MMTDEYLNKIVKRIKQIIPIESGWVQQYLMESLTEKGKFTTGEFRITGQALVERTFPEGTVTEDVEFLVFDDDGVLVLSSDSEEQLMLGINTYPLGVCPSPGFRLSPEDLSDEIARYYKKNKKKKYDEELKARRAAKKAA